MPLLAFLDTMLSTASAPFYQLSISLSLFPPSLPSSPVAISGSSRELFYSRRRLNEGNEVSGQLQWQVLKAVAEFRHKPFLCGDLSIPGRTTRWQPQFSLSLSSLSPSSLFLFSFYPPSSLSPFLITNPLLPPILLFSLSFILLLLCF